MSRCGPRGQTAADQTRVMEPTPPSIAEARLDDEAEAWIDDQWQEMKDAGHPVGKRYLRQKLVADWERQRMEEAIKRREIENPVYVLTYADPTGEEAVHELMLEVS